MPNKEKRFSASPKQTDSRSYPVLYTKFTGVRSPEYDGRGMDVITVRSAEVKNKWIPNSTLLHVLTACTGITFTVLLCLYCC
jgi:hypothetical protein